MACDRPFLKAGLWFDEHTSYIDFTKCYMCKHHETVFKGNYIEYMFCGLVVKETGCTSRDAVIDEDYPFICDMFERGE